MISEHELTAAIVAVEQSIHDSEEAKIRDKHDSAKLKEISVQLIIDKTKLQMLHYAQGIIGMITEEQLNEALAVLHKYIDHLHDPQETDLFEAPGDQKELERQKLIARTKMLALNFIAGEEKKIL